MTIEILVKPKIKELRKRDGHIVNFDEQKITEAIYKAAKSVGGSDLATAGEISQRVIIAFNEKFHERSIPAVEEIQDLVEKVLIDEGHAKTAKAYIIYREMRSKKRTSDSAFLEIKKSVEEYVERSDWRVKENSNSDYSFSGLMSHTAGKIIANYALNEMYPPQISEAHRNGAIHIHDLGHAIIAYCAGWSLKQLIQEGFGGVKHKTNSKPAKHLDVLVIQMVNFLGTMQMEHAGAQAFNSVDTLLAPFVRADNLDYKQVRQNMQRLVFSLNVPSRWGSQPPFTNFTLDWVCPEDMKDLKAIIGGIEQDFTYGECQTEMDMVNKAFLEVMNEGDADGRTFFYPIPTYNITKDFQWETDNANLLFEMTSKYGTPYFQNFINSVLKPSDVRSMCCRLQLDLRELRNKTGGLFGSGEQTGSIGVVTINLPRLGYTSKNETEFFEKLDQMIELAGESLEIKRQEVSKNMKNNLMPYAKRYLGSYDNHFSTIGINGMHEALLNLFGYGIDKPEGREFATRLIDHIKERLSDIQEKTGNLYNLEASPCESATYRFALRDQEQFPDIIQGGTKETPYYTNSSQLPVGHTEDIFEVFEHQQALQNKYTGGTVIHGFLGEKIEDPEVCKRLVKKLAESYTVPYFTITPTFSLCAEHGYIAGAHENCPHMVADEATKN